MNAKSELHNLVNNLKTLLPIANSHMVHFITHNSFEQMIPTYLQDEIMSLDENELNQMVLSGFSDEELIQSNKNTPNLLSFLNSAQKLSLKHSSSCILFEEFVKNVEAKDISGSTHHISKHLMSMKKCHEVEIMSAIIAAISKEENCTHVVDVGGGKGYLSSVLALKHQLKVLSIDSSLVTSQGAEKQMPKIEKLWKTFQKKSLLENASSLRNESKIEEQKHYSELCKIGIHFITEKTDLIAMLKHSFEDDEVSNIMLAGLHTCGDLASSSIQLFVNNPDNIKCLVNVGCCYNLISEEFDLSPSYIDQPSESGASGAGFPMSAYLRDQKFVLGRNARMLATQPPDRMCHNQTVETEVLFYRALLEVYLEKKLGPANRMSQFRVGKFKRKCSNFTEYVHKSIKRLGVEIEVDNAELQQLWNSHSEVSRKQLHAFFLLKLTVAPAIEAAVMLDRLLYLQEQGIEDAYLAQLFDPVVSPRCFAVVAFNRPRTRLQ